MATNDFLVFGGGAGANVITQVTYSGLAARTAGFASGVAQSAQLNKVWRQSSIMSAVLAQFISDITGQDVLDDGSTTTLLVNLKAASRAQSVAVVGSAVNAKMQVTAASASATFTADEIVLKSALGGLAYVLPSFSKAVNLGTTGAGGMDTGTAPASGYVALYAIYNPATGASALLAKNATSAKQSEVYGGANMPSGYTASALVSVWPTNGSGQFITGTQAGRTVARSNAVVLNSGTVVASPTSLSISSAVPPNAIQVLGSVGGLPNSGQAAGTAAVTVAIFADAAGNGGSSLGSIAGGGSGANANVSQQIFTPQTVYYTTSINTGTANFTFTVTGYAF